MTDRTECLECHGWFIKLSRHLKSHGMMADDYRVKYGFRLGQTLDATGTKSNSSTEIYTKRQRTPLDYLIEKEINIYGSASE